jgi:hypothetical protein
MRPFTKPNPLVGETVTVKLRKEQWLKVKNRAAINHRTAVEELSMIVEDAVGSAETVLKAMDAQKTSIFERDKL